jgi:hypothetical protein
MPEFSVSFSRCFRFSVTAADGATAVKKIDDARNSIDHNLQLPLAEKIEEMAGSGVEFTDFWSKVSLEHEISDDESGEGPGKGVGQ